VWDPIVRLFHWSLVLAFIVAYATGEEESAIHTNAGYIILVLLLTRIIWGFIGSQHARFSDFVSSPSSAIGYIKGLFSRQHPKRYLGHNPAGGWMIFALIFSLGMTIFTGLKLEATEGRGLLAESGDTIVMQSYRNIETDDYENEHERSEYYEHENEEGEELWEEIHEFFANFTLFLVMLHVGGVLFSSIREHQNLIKSMVTGYKE
jgi:cytochrome b